MTSDMEYMKKLDEVAKDAVGLIREKTGTYGDSWKRRGSAGAWFTTVRPIDRLEGIMQRYGGDIFRAIADDHSGRDGSALACVRDIMNYMILIEAHARARLGVGSHGPVRKADDSNRPKCAECQEEFNPEDCVRHPDFPATIFCSTECAQVYETGTFRCDECGAKRTREHLVIIPSPRFVSRQFCSSAHASKYKAEHQPSPASGSHHAVEEPGETLEDTAGAGGTQVANRSAQVSVALGGFRDDRVTEMLVKTKEIALLLGLQIDVSWETRNRLVVSISQ